MPVEHRQAPDWAVHLPPGCGREDVDLLAGGNLTARWSQRWAGRPDAPALRDADGRWLSAGELEERSRRAALALRAAGLRPGERVILAAESSARFVVAYVAALRAGLTVVPLNPAYTEREVTAIAADCRPRAAVDGDHRHAQWIGRGAGRPVSVLGPDPGEWPGGPREPASAAGLDAAAPADTAVLMYTSGTTGRPKGVPLSHANLLASATAVGLAWRWESDDRLLLTLPLFHVHGLGVGLHGSLGAGAAVILRSGFDPADIAEHSRGEATLFFGVPTMYQRLAAGGWAGDLRSLRLLVSGSAPLPAPLAQAIGEQAGQMPLERYGMTETMMLAGNPYAGERRPGTVGFPFPGVQLRLDQRGEVEVRGPNVIAGYLDRPEATAEAFTPDGWFRTGDLGELDGDGYLRLVGRSKELIISGGYNVFPREVEEVLATHPGVAEVAVVGRPSERWGEEVTAVIVAASPVDPESVREHARQRLAPYKVPKRIEFAAELPRNAMGKVVRGQL